MNQSYLQTFNQQELENYLLTLRKRIADLIKFNQELEAENIPLVIRFQELKAEKLRRREEELKNNKFTIGNIFNKGKHKINQFLHRNQSKETHPNQQEAISAEHQPHILAQKHLEISNINENGLVMNSNDLDKIKSERIDANNFDFDDIYTKGKQKITYILSEGGVKIKKIMNKMMQKEQTFSENDNQLQEEAQEYKMIPNDVTEIDQHFKEQLYRENTDMNRHKDNIENDIESNHRTEASNQDPNAINYKLEKIEQQNEIHQKKAELIQKQDYEVKQEGKDSLIQ